MTKYAILAEKLFSLCKGRKFWRSKFGLNVSSNHYHLSGNNFTLFYNYAQARLKLPKKAPNTLVGAANALVAEHSQVSMSPDDGSDAEENEDKISRKSLEISGINSNITFSKRYVKYFKEHVCLKR